MYGQPYKLSKDTYDKARATLPNPESFPDFYVPFPSAKPVSVKSSTLGASLQSQSDLYVMIEVGSQQEAGDFSVEISPFINPYS
jgi:hypothetical protein